MTYVVEFINSNLIQAVPVCWISKHGVKFFSSWPDHLKKFPKKINNAINSSQIPSQEYGLYEVKILKQFVDLELANNYARKVEKFSSTQSSSNSLGRGKRKRIKNKFFHSTPRKSSTESDSTSSSLSLNLLPSIEIIPTNELGEDIIDGTDSGEDPHILSRISEITSNSLKQKRNNYTMEPQIDNRQLSPPPVPHESQNRRTTELSFLQKLDSKSILIHIIENQMKIFARLDKMEEEIKNVNTTITDDINNPPDNLNISLPINNMYDFQRLEEYLKTRNNIISMMKYLKPLCNKLIKSTAENILKELLSDEIASHFNYHGKSPKKRFYLTNVEKLVFFCTRNTTNCTRDNDYKIVIMKWLKYAPQRIKNLKKKITRADNEEDFFNI